MTLFKSALSIVGLIFLLSATRCYSQTAEEMLSACRPIAKARVTRGTVEFPENFDAGLCWGAFASVQSLVTFSDVNFHPMLGVCLPKDVTRTQLVAIFIAYMEKRPQEYNRDFAPEIVNSLLAVYPCKQPK